MITYTTSMAVSIVTAVRTNISIVAQALMDWPYAGRPFEVAQYIADLVSPLPLFRMCDPEQPPPFA